MYSDIDVIESEDDELTQEISLKREPISIHGNGHITMFGLNSRFDKEFPGVLKGRVAPEEFSKTMRRINGLLRKSMPNNIRWLLCGLLFCCCTAGCSLWPVVCLSKRTVHTVEKVLDHENQTLYNKLGLNWRLTRRSTSSNQSMVEYVLLLEFLPKTPLLIPD